MAIAAFSMRGCAITDLRLLQQPIISIRLRKQHLHHNVSCLCTYGIMGGSKTSLCYPCKQPIGPASNEQHTTGRCNHARPLAHGEQPAQDTSANKIPFGLLLGDGHKSTQSILSCRWSNVVCNRTRPDQMLSPMGQVALMHRTWRGLQ